MIASVYRKRPIEVVAVRWDGTIGSATEIIGWVLSLDGTASYVDPFLHSPSCRCDGRALVPSKDPAVGYGVPVPCPETNPTGDTYLRIRTIDPADARAYPGDWVIRGTQGEFYPCKPDVFAATYEGVNTLSG